MARGKKKNRKNQTAATTVVENTLPPDSALPPWSRVDNLWLALSLVLSLLVYLYTMWPDVAGGDSGELTAVAYTLGVVHPPGYPLYTMIAHLFTYLPFGTVGWRVNLLSCVLSLGAQTFLFLTLRRLTKQNWLAFAVASLLAFSPLVWRYAILAEVFSLNNFFVGALIYGMVRAVQNHSPKNLYWLALIFGLGLSNHHTLLFIGGPVGLYLLWYFRAEMMRPRTILALSCLVLVGMLPYAYLFWASARAPLVSWGDITSWQGFLTHFLRKEYGTFQLATEGSKKFQLFYGLAYFLMSFAQVVGYLGLIPLTLGIYALWRAKTPRGAVHGRLLIALPLLYLVVFHWLANLPFVDGAALYRDIVSRFWLMPIWLFTLIFAIGCGQLLEKASPTQRQALKILLLVSPFIALVVHFKNENHRDNTTVVDFGRHLLEKLPPNTLYFTLGDINTNSVRYLQACENFRTDVKVLDRSLMSYPWTKRIAAKHFPDVILPGIAYHPSQSGYYDFKKLFDANYSRQTIFMTMIKTKNASESSDKAWEASYMLVPYGLSFKLATKNKDFDIETYETESAKYLIDPTQAFAKPPLPDSWDAVILANYWLAHHVRAAEILKYALRTQNKKYFEESERLLEDLVIRNPNPPADYFKNLGIAHQHLTKVTTGEDLKNHERRMLEVWELYIAKTDRRDKTYDDIRNVLKAYGHLK